MTPLASWLFRVLMEQGYRGKENAMSVKALADWASGDFSPLNERRLREAKDELWDGGHMIGSCVHGYYLIETIEEAAEAVRYYREPAMDLLAKASARWKVAQQRFGSAWQESPLSRAAVGEQVPQQEGA